MRTKSIVQYTDEDCIISCDNVRQKNMYVKKDAELIDKVLYEMYDVLIELG